MSLFDNYSEDKVIRTFGTDTCKKLKSNRIRKPFCNIALDPDKKRDNRSAFVVSTARLTDESQKIYYLLKWDSQILFLLEIILVNKLLIILADLLKIKMLKADR